MRFVFNRHSPHIDRKYVGLGPSLPRPVKSRTFGLDPGANWRMSVYGIGAVVVLRLSDDIVFGRSRWPT